MTGRFHNQLLRARVSKTRNGFEMKFTPNNPSLDPRFIAAGLYDVGSEMERRSHDIGAGWEITVDASASARRITVELTPDDSAARAEQFLAGLIRDYDLEGSAKERA